MSSSSLGEDRTRVEHDLDVLGEPSEPLQQRISRRTREAVATHADEVTSRRLRGLQRLDADDALGGLGGDERALGGRLEHDDADTGVEVGDDRAGDDDALRLQRGPHEVTVRSRPRGPGMDALGSLARGGEEDVDRSPGVLVGWRRHDVATATRQRRDVDDDVDERLRGVDHPGRHGPQRMPWSLVPGESSPGLGLPVCDCKR